MFARLSTLSLFYYGFTAASSLAPGQIKNLVTFGDSYSDVTAMADGGTAWPTYAAGYANVSLFPFAKAGATCSNNITNRPFPSVFESQLPDYFAERSNGTLPHLVPEETLYTLWIGTNDVGANGLLTGHGALGVSLVDTVSCAIDWVKVMYASGARNFLFQNMVPLQNTVLYSADSYFNHYWTMERNTSEWNIFMSELTRSGNKLQELMLEALVPSLKDAHLGLFDSYSLFEDMIAHPAAYLNGTAPLNTSSCVHACHYQLNESTADMGICTIANGTDRDSFLWYDELHPSEQTDRNIAKEVAEVIEGKDNRWTRWMV
ncbi:carbohydrate esterase family 16 protein [Collybiopsis luxurians FD-317 M1]|uniref:Carbohydrate esterase family 16 protein n=1 Tax=Collybiopsis luxurians FD-317 M1 TaxID=944289 RepID=A0A0D0CM89_9AGAR|nr:carbohydrate esterase family 16 protein [Collybiopsis luxurians FD-317 M1]